MTRLRLYFALLFHPLQRALWYISVHESGNFRNTISKEHNNYFSYGFYSGSPHQAGGSPGRFAHYSTALHSVKDVMGWFERRSSAYKALEAFDESPNESTAYQLASEMAANKYFTAPVQTYANGLIAARNKYPAYLFGGVGSSIFVLIVAALLFSSIFCITLLLRWVRN